MKPKVTDAQKSKVYAWENKIVAPKDTTQIPIDIAQSIVNHIWAAEGLRYPPKVELIPACNKNGGDATRLTIRLKPTTYTWIIIHEMAHSMTSTMDGDSVGHGPIFVGVYMKLLEKYAGMNLPVLMHTARLNGVQFDIMASPIFLDA